MQLCEQILDNLTTPVMVFDRQMHLTFLNPAAEDLLGFSANHAQKVRARDIFPDRDYIELLQHGIMHEQAFIQRNIAVLTAAHETLRVDSVSTPLFDYQHNGYDRVMLEVYDLTKRHGQEFNVQSQVDATRAVVRGLAHEIKNPLGGLRGAAQLLEKELPDPGLKEYTRIIIGEADRLQNLLNRMLVPNRMPVKQTMNIHQAVERVAHLVRAELPDNICIQRDYDPSIPELMADEDQLIQALLNIVRNAAQALSQQANGLIVLRTRTERQINIGGHVHKLAVRVDVIDNGPGIPAELSEKIFYPMVTGRPEGTGLGLSIAQSLINHHGGSLQFHCEENRTVFTFLLPLES